MKHTKKCAAQADAAAAQLSASDRRLATIRNGLSLAFIGLLFLTLFRFRPWTAFLFAASFTAVVVVAWFQEKAARKLVVARSRAAINRRQSARMHRRWSDIHVVEPSIPADAQQLALDLDLFGKASLWQLISRAHTSLGQQTLSDWLLCPSSLEEIRGRQQATTALAGESVFREEVELHAQLLASRKIDPQEFLEWLSAPCWLEGRSILKWVCRILTAAMIVLPCAIWWQWLPAEWFVVVLGLMVIHIGLNVAYVGQVHDIFNQSVKGSYETSHYATLFRAVAQLPSDAGLLEQMRDRIQTQACAI